MVIKINVLSFSDCEKVEERPSENVVLIRKKDVSGTWVRFIMMIDQ